MAYELVLPSRIFRSSRGVQLSAILNFDVLPASAGWLEKDEKKTSFSQNGEENHGKTQHLQQNDLTQISGEPEPSPFEFIWFNIFLNV